MASLPRLKIPGPRLPLPLILLALGLIAIVAVAACGDDDGDDGDANGDGDEAGPTELIGLFSLAAGVCDADGIVTTGSFFKMTDPESNPLPNSTPTEGCDATNDPLSPGTDGGLLTGEYQEHPDPVFDEEGNGLASGMMTPRLFFAFNYAFATSADVIPTGGTESASVPSITFDPATGTLTGDLSALSIAWQQNFFAQGMPRAAGLPTEPNDEACEESAIAGAFPNSAPAAPVTGTYDPATGAYTLEWSSRIGGSFGCGFTGHWHFEGTFTAS